MTDVPLREYVDQQIDWLHKFFQTRFSDSEKSIDVAFTSLNSRLEGMNEIRESMSRLMQTFSTIERVEFLRSQYAKDHDDLTARVAALEKRRFVMEGEKTGGEPLGRILLVVVAGVLVALVVYAIMGRAA